MRPPELKFGAGLLRALPGRWNFSSISMIVEFAQILRVVHAASFWPTIFFNKPNQFPKVENCNKLNPSLYFDEVAEVPLSPVEQLWEGGHEAVRSRPADNRVTRLSITKQLFFDPPLLTCVGSVRLGLVFFSFKSCVSELSVDQMSRNLVHF